MTASFAHKEIKGGLVTNAPKYQLEFDFSHPEIVKHNLEIAGDIGKRETQQKVVLIFAPFQRIKVRLSYGEITVFPASKTRINLASFCASYSKAAPEENELFFWKMGLPDIQLLKEMLSFYIANPDLNKNLVQEIVWNLENETRYENYPENLKAILRKFAATAPLILPSAIKSRISEILIPEKIKSFVSIVKGQYHSFNEFNKFIREQKSAFPANDKETYSNLPNTNISTTTSSNSYESQNIIFYNSTRNFQNFVISDLFLQPAREDVQPIVLASVMPYSDEIQRLLNSIALKMLGHLAAGYPTLNNAEKNLVREKPMKAAVAFYHAVIAENKAEEVFPNSKPNGNTDAFRHFVWSGLLVRDLGEESARTFLNAHEMTVGQSPDEEAMDQFNNERGISSAKELLRSEYFDDTAIFEKAKSELDAGTLRVLTK